MSRIYLIGCNQREQYTISIIACTIYIQLRDRCGKLGVYIHMDVGNDRCGKLGVYIHMDVGNEKVFTYNYMIDVEN